VQNIIIVENKNLKLAAFYNHRPTNYADLNPRDGGFAHHAGLS